MILEWQRKPKPYSMVWIGPNGIETSVGITIEDIEEKIAVISGPRGEKGEKGDPGELGGVPTLLDGGNF